MRFHRSRDISLEDWLALVFVLICLYVLFRLFRFGEDRLALNDSYSGYVVGIGMPLWLIGGVSTFLSPVWRLAVWAFLVPVCVVCFVHILDLPFRRALLLTLLILPIGLAAFPAAAFIKGGLGERPSVGALPNKKRNVANSERQRRVISIPGLNVDARGCQGRPLAGYACSKTDYRFSFNFAT
jgi:hypothetical protein